MLDNKVVVILFILSVVLHNSKSVKVIDKMFGFVFVYCKKTYLWSMGSPGGGELSLFGSPGTGCGE